MLRRNSSDFHLGARKGMDVILKHKIRNLRAKLKNLLSSDSCQKYSKRQKQVKKIQQLQNKQFYMTKAFFNQDKHLFTYTKQQPKQLWYSDKQKCNVMNVFGRLTKEQIEQINEDVIYYLGEDHVQRFKEFLEAKGDTKNSEYKQNFDNPIRRLKTLKEEENPDDKDYHESKKVIQTERKESCMSSLPKFNKNCSIGQNFFGFRQSMQSNISYQNSNPSNKRLKTANLIESRTSTLSKRSAEKQRRFQANYLGNRQNFLKNRKMIEEEQNAQRLLTKINLEMKQEKAVDIFKTTQDAFLSTIKQKNTQNDCKTKKILEDKYKKNVTFGSIVQLNEELRKIYIKKITQSPSPTTLQVPDDKSLDKRKYNTTLSNFFSQSNSHYKSKY